MKCLLVTNDFPPKIGGIQNYLWELWSRLPPEFTSVYCCPYKDDAVFDAKQNFAIERSPEPVLIPYPWLGARIRRIAEQTNSALVILDPALPLGHLGPNLGLPYAVVLHGAEVAIPARLPGTKTLLRRTLESASLVIAAGDYALAEAERCVGHLLPSVVIPPGVDGQRFKPRSELTKQRVRAAYGVGENELLLSAVSRLVPRKGFETLIRALAGVNESLRQEPASQTIKSDDASGAATKRVVAVIGGTGRERQRLEHLAQRLDVPVRFTGRLDDEAVAELYSAADLMAMLCNERWFGLEQEGFGIAFLEAAASGIPQVAGRSGGSHEAVENGQTGLIVEDPKDHVQVASEILKLVVNSELREKMGTQARIRAVGEFSYDRLAEDLHTSLRNVISEVMS